MNLYVVLVLSVVLASSSCLQITQRLLDRTTYNLQYKYGTAMTPLYITIHNTANSAPAINEANYLNTRNDNAYISFHYVVDESIAYQLLPDNIHGWHAGDGSGDGNKRSIAIEIARSLSDNVALKNQATLNGAELAAILLKRFGWNTSKLRKHQDWSGKYCPHDILERYGWDNFVARVQGFLNALG